MIWGTIIKPSEKGISSNLGLSHTERAICLGYVGKTQLSILVLREGYKVPQKYHINFWETNGKKLNLRK